MPRIKFFSIIILSVLFTMSLFVGAEDIVWDKIIGAKTSSLSSKQKQDVARNLSAIANTRGCKGSLIQCLAKNDQTARRHAGFVVRMINKNKTDAYIKKAINLRAESSFPEETFNIKTGNRPFLGSNSAKVVIVEYACFQCPYCSYLAPKLKKLQKKFKGQIKHVYKFFPVRSHTNGVQSALAALAAQRQNKFWEMYNLLYANISDLDADDIQKYASKIGLDMTQFNADLKDKALMKIIEKDKLEGMRFGVDGTPTFFVNGKLLQGISEYEEIVDRIGEELDIVNGKIK